MADKDEQWDGPVDEASTPMAERLETLEAGNAPEEVTESFPPIEERVARLERIAEYLHDARREAASLANSVDTLANATKALTALLAAVEAQQKRIEKLDERVNEFRHRIIRRSVIIGSCLVALLALGGVVTILQERTINRIEAEAAASVERVEAESFARGVANCEASNEFGRAFRAFVMAVFETDGAPTEQGNRIIRLAEEGFPLRDCAKELAEASEGK